MLICNYYFFSSFFLSHLSTRHFTQDCNVCGVNERNKSDIHNRLIELLGPSECCSKHRNRKEKVESKTPAPKNTSKNKKTCNREKEEPVYQKFYQCTFCF
jgi:hypothetical protein